MLLPVLSTIDVAYLVRAGQIMLDEGGILRTDPFGLATVGGPWVNQQWLSEVVFALAYRAGGWEALVVARAILFVLAFSLIYASCRARGVTAKLSALLTIGAFIVSFGLDLRAELLGITLFALVQWLLAIRYRWPQAIWVVPLVVAVWSNVHGSFFLGPILLALAYLEDRVDHPDIAKRASVATILALVATALNPFGVAVWPYALGLSTSGRVTETVMEWGPTTVRSAIGILFFASLAAVSWLLVRRSSELSLTSLLTLGLFAVGALWAIRGVAWWGVALPSILAPLLVHEGDEAPESRHSRWINGAFATALALLAIAFLPWWRTADRPAEALLRFAPSNLTAALAEITGTETRMFNPQPWGSWFELAVPGRPTFVDARIEVPPDAVWRDYFVISGAQRNWAVVVERWAFDVIVADHVQQRSLIDALGERSEWRRVYADAEGVIFVRQ